MKIHRSVDKVGKIKNLCVSIGTFDGVHLGHKQIIDTLIANARKHKGESMIITFDPHPRITLGYDAENLSLINNIDEKLKIFEKLKINHVLIIQFTKQFSKLSSEEFVKHYLNDKLNVKHLTLGYDHQFGNREKSKGQNLKEILQKYNIECERVKAVDKNSKTVSSTKIRKAVENGNIKEANRLLGYNYEITAKVVGGRKIGREIGFPTANLDIIGYKKLVPEDGVYQVKVYHNNKEYTGVLNVGLNPTVENKFRTVEVHILNFSQDIYNHTLRVEFIKKIRDEMKFSSIEELKIQIRKDVEEVEAEI